MVGEFVPSPVDPVDAGGEFWRRYHEFRRVRQKETRPDEPVRDDADEEARMKRISPFQGDEFPKGVMRCPDVGGGVAIGAC